MTSNSGLTLPPSAYSRRPSSVPLPLHNTSDFIPFAGYSPHALDMSMIALPSVPFISQTRPSSPINNISHQNQQRTLGHRRASSAQPVFRRLWTLPINPTTFTNTDLSGFDWTTTPMTSRTTQIQRDESPLPDVAPELFNGFSFDDALSFSLSSSASSASSSDRNSPPSWLDTAAPHHSRSHSQQHLAIAPYDLPPLH